jgi:hypothetical protein
MKTNDVQIPVEAIEFIPVETIEPCAPRPVRTPRIIAVGAAAIMSVAALAAVFPRSGNEPTPPAAPTVRLSEREQLEVLVERGLIPRQALEPLLSEREQLEVLVERGLVPRQALEPTPPTRVATIAGPAHPLGATDLGIPCSSLAYTRC